MRSTAIQLSTPDALRGRVSAVNMIFIGASNQLGAVESGFVAAATSADLRGRERRRRRAGGGAPGGVAQSALRHYRAHEAEARPRRQTLKNDHVAARHGVGASGGKGGSPPRDSPVGVPGRQLSAQIDHLVSRRAAGPPPRAASAAAISARPMPARCARVDRHQADVAVIAAILDVDRAPPARRRARRRGRRRARAGVSTCAASMRSPADEVRLDSPVGEH